MLYLQSAFENTESRNPHKQNRTSGIEINACLAQKIFLLAMAVLFVLFITFAALGIGEQQRVFFARGNDMFADSVKMMRDYIGGPGPYHTAENDPGMGLDPSTRGSYLPIAFLLYQGMWRISGGEDSTTETRLLTAMFVSFAMFFMLEYALALLMRGLPGRRKLHICMALAVTGVALFTVERGNFITLTVLLCTLFIGFYRSENRVQRELSFLALALAAALKAVPALLGLMLLFERRWKEAVRLLLYGAVLAFLPFICFDGGFSNLKIMLSDVNSASGLMVAQIHEVRFGLDYIAQMFNRVQEAYGGAEGLKWLNTMASWMRGVLPEADYIVGGLLVVTVPFQKQPWKKWCALLLLFLLPQNNGTYSALYLFPAIVLFLTQREWRRMDAVYGLLFLCILSPLQYCVHFPQIVYAMTGKELIINHMAIYRSIALVLLMALLAVDQTVAAAKWMLLRWKQHRNVSLQIRHADSEKIKDS